MPLFERYNGIDYSGAETAEASLPGLRMPVHRRLWFLTFKARSSKASPLDGPGISRFPCKELFHIPGSTTTPGQWGTRDVASHRAAFRLRNGVGTRNPSLRDAAPWLACELPCRRFVDTLADASARLGDDVVRYSFLASDFHRLLLPVSRRTAKDTGHYQKGARRSLPSRSGYRLA